jgi:hypothetical protein
MKITNEWLKEKDACQSGKDWFKKQSETDGVKLVESLVANQKLDWANWLIVRIMERKQYLAYAIYAAEQVLDFYEKKYPNDKRPRLAIDAAKKCLDNDSADNRSAAASAAYSAYAYASAAYAAASAAYAAAYASAAAYAYAAADAAYAAAYAAYAAACNEMKIKIINYGLKLLKGEK